MLFWFLTSIQIIILITGFIIIIRLFYIISTFYQKKTVPYVPTPKSVVKKMVQNSGLLKAVDQQRTVRIIDLGSGTGKMVFYLAKNTPKNIKIYGVEKSKLLYLIAKTRCFFSANKRRIYLTCNNWDKINLTDFDFIFCFLVRKVFKELLPKFRKELKKETKIISYLFPLPANNFFTEKIFKLNKKDNLFIYQINKLVK